MPLGSEAGGGSEEGDGRLAEGGVRLWCSARVKDALMPGRLSGCPSRYLFASVVGLNWISALKRHTPGRSVIAFTSWQLITACSRANKRTRKNK